MSSSVAVVSLGPCSGCRSYVVYVGANHGGQTCVAAPLSIISSSVVLAVCSVAGGCLVECWIEMAAM